MTNLTASEAANEHEKMHGERVLHARVEWFFKKWSEEFDLNRRQSAEFNADIIMLVQEVNRDASRYTHDMLAKALAVMPAPSILLKK